MLRSATEGMAKYALTCVAAARLFEAYNRRLVELTLIDAHRVTMSRKVAVKSDLLIDH